MAKDGSVLKDLSQAWHSTGLRRIYVAAVTVRVTAH
jgi:hypothetical protein